MIYEEVGASLAAINQSPSNNTKIDKNFLVWVKMLIKTDAFVYKIDEMQYEL